MDENTENTDPNAETPSEPQPAESAAQPAQPAVSQDSKNMAMLCHLLGLFTSFLGPLILWLIKKDEDEYVDQQGKEALNFQITIIIASVVSAILTFICIGFIMAIFVSVLDIVFSIIAAVAASKGQDYRYPVSIRLLK